MSATRSVGTLIALFAVLSACDDDAVSVKPALVVQLKAAGKPLRAIVSTANNVLAVNCPGGKTLGGLRCTADGIALDRVAAGDELTLKVRGYQFVTHAITASDVASGQLQQELQALPDPDDSSDYRTRFDDDDAEAQFLALASDSTSDLGATHSVKFYVADLHGTPRVYFQNTRLHPLHYDFARDVLGVAQSRAEFEQRTYHGAQRTALAGTLSYTPSHHFDSAAYGGKLEGPIQLEFFPSDDLTAEMALLAHRLLEERLNLAKLSGSSRRLVYVPAGSDQESSLTPAVASFAAREALHSRQVEVYAGITEQRLNPGVAFGTLRRLDPDQLAQDAVSFRDVLVLTRLPNDLPLVGGTLTEELQTPLAHVNLAARARGTPNAAILDAAADPRIGPLLGKLVRYEVRADAIMLEAASQEAADGFWNARTPEPLSPVSDLSFTGLPGFPDLHFADSLRVGAKAANLAELRRVLGEQAPDGFAVPFSAYAAYMRGNSVTELLCKQARSDCGSEMRAADVCDSAQAVCSRGLAAHDTFDDYAARVVSDAALRDDSRLREAALDGLKFLVRHGRVDTTFADALDARAAEIFGDAQIRLRSSTNVEDLPGFSGAGLYESFSAYASGDDRASLEIRKVWASVFEWRAFEERQFWNVDETRVRMGVAVNRAYDDEAANGVLITKNLQDPGAEGLYVNVQQGELAVTNPEQAALPEVFTIVPAQGGDVQVMRERFSSLSPDLPLLAADEIATLADAAERTVVTFAPLYKIPASMLALDLEFKFVGDSRALVIKQARPYAAR